MVQVVADPLARLEPAERVWVETFRDGVRDLLGDRLRNLRLFGSKARGDSDDESDIDLLVLVDALDSTTQHDVWDVAWSISSWLSPLVEDFDHYHRPGESGDGPVQGHAQGVAAVVAPGTVESAYEELARARRALHTPACFGRPLDRTRCSCGPSSCAARPTTAPA